MWRRGLMSAMLITLALTCWSASAVADDPDADAQWEQVEPGDQPADSQPPPTVQSRQASPEVCTNLGIAISQIVMLRDHGIPKDRLTNAVGMSGANAKVHQYVLGYIDFIYGHPEMTPAQIKAQFTAACAKAPR
jgi:hypothetical protein